MAKRTCRIDGCERLCDDRHSVCITHRKRAIRGHADCLVSGCTGLGRYEGPTCHRHQPRACVVRYGQCIWCGQLYIIRSTGKTPRHCLALSRRGTPTAKGYKPVQAATIACRGCGEPFESPGWVRLCERCRREHRRTDKDRYKARRRMRLGVVRIERVVRRQVFERDGWRCWICRCPVRRDVAVPDPFAPTLDHVVPLVAGGEHSYANIRCAHFLCNSVRGAGVA